MTHRLPGLGQYCVLLSFSICSRFRVSDNKPRSHGIANLITCLLSLFVICLCCHRKKRIPEQRESGNEATVVDYLNSRKQPRLQCFFVDDSSASGSRSVLCSTLS